MSRHSDRPQTRVSHPMPTLGSHDWVIWAAWADRVTFEEIQEVSGLTEADVITLMRRSLKRSRCGEKRARASSQSLKHRKRFQQQRRALRSWSMHADPESED